MTTKNAITLLAVGDLHACKKEPQTYFRQCRDLLREADITFGQFEGAISSQPAEVCSSQGRACCPKTEIAGALADCGFDIMSLASNHAMDGGSPGLLNTIRLFERNGIRTVGAGETLQKARSPVLLECKGARIAFLSACSVMPVGYEADDDRPGVAPLHAHTYYEPVDYQPGSPPLVRTTCDEDDLKALVDSVKAVRPQADVVVASLHFGVHHVPEYLADYQEEAAHAVIDAGADLVLGHHPHILKGIEVYKGKVVFYSIGNFALDSSGCMKPPMHWFYRQQTRHKIIKGYPWYHRNALEHDAPASLTKGDYEKAPHLANLDARKAIVAKAVIRANRIERVSFLPTLIGADRVPEVLERRDPRAEEILEYVKVITRSQGLSAAFAWDGDEVVITNG